MRIVSSGRLDAKYWIVGEALGADEDAIGRPFVGVSGHELYRMLEEARWLPPGTAEDIIRNIYRKNFIPLEKALDAANIRITNVCHERPPANEIDAFFANKTNAKLAGYPLIAGRYPLPPIADGLQQLATEISECRPVFILALGGTALWALTGSTGITKWRGSILPVADGPVGDHSTKIVPTFHPADVLREWPHRAIAVQDMRRARRERESAEIRRPTYHFIIAPTIAEVRDYVDYHCEDARCNEPLAADIETPHGWRDLPGHIACIGFAHSRDSAICVPLMCLGDLEGYWSPAEEAEVVLLMRRLMQTRPCIFHRGIFEVQHFARHWGFLPRWEHDTMVMQHILYPGLLGGKIDPVTQKVGKKGSSLSLLFISSMYCEYHRAWKDDGRTWNQKETPDEHQWWRYNAEDNVRTFECFEVLRESLQKGNLWKQYEWMMSLAGPIVYMMLKGISTSREVRNEMRGDVQRQRKQIQAWVDGAVGHQMDMHSTPRRQALFYHDLAAPKILNRRTKRPTLDDDALTLIAKRVPLLAPLCQAFIDEGSLATFDNNFLRATIADDERWRTEINLTGTETLRFSSTKNPFNEGLNLQNIPRMPD